VGIYLAMRPSSRPAAPPVETTRTEPPRARDPEPIPPPAVAAPARDPAPPPPPSTTGVAQPATVTRADPEPETPARPAPTSAAKRPPKAPEPAGETVAARAPFKVRDTLNSIPVPSASSGFGVLQVQAEPFGEVYLDGKHHGEAPMEFQVHAGTYAVRVIHPTLGVREKRVAVVAGKRVPWTANFEK